ncbi:hypothetical protein Axi01nite_10590 [Actinoplanes xinjiangensis]|nr:hypothetical protein Axi01nite_10590 [Actinoplanes xinjiangensis]
MHWTICLPRASRSSSDIDDDAAADGSPPAPGEQAASATSIVAATHLMTILMAVRLVLGAAPIVRERSDSPRPPYAHGMTGRSYRGPTAAGLAVSKLDECPG